MAKNEPGELVADNETTYRRAVAADLPAITVVRTAVTENHLSVEQMAERGITNASVAASFLADSRGWVAERDGRIVAFAIADRAQGSIFALFVQPGCDGQGIGSALLALASDWLWAAGCARIWLETRHGTRAAMFYERQGWHASSTDPKGSIRFERDRP